MTTSRHVPRLLALIAALAMLLTTAGVALAARQWTLDASPTSLHESQTVVTLSVQNVGGNGGGDEITCVTVDVPTSFTVDSVSIVSIGGATSGHGWTTVTGSVAGGTRVAFKNPTDKNPLVGLPVGDKAVFRVTVTPGTAGSTDWTGGAADKPGTAGSTKCGSGTFPTATLGFSVTASTPAPTATPKPTPKPTPTATATPDPTPNPVPTTTPTAPPPTTPAPTTTPKPPANPTPRPTPAPTASPGRTASPAPSRTPSPSLSPTSAPTVGPQVTPTSTPVGAATPGPTQGSPSAGTSAPATSPTPTPAPTPSPPASDDAGAMVPPPGGGPSAGPGGGFGAPDAAGGPIDGARLAIADGRSDGDGLGSDAVGEVALAALTELGIGAWAVPGVVVGVPGLLVVLAVLLQAAGAGAWLPVARRGLSGTGAEQRRSQGWRPRSG